MAFVKTEVTLTDMPVGSTISYGGLVLADSGDFAFLRTDDFGLSQSTIKRYARNPTTGNFEPEAAGFTYPHVAPLVNPTTHIRHVASPDGTWVAILERPGGSPCQIRLYILIEGVGWFWSGTTLTNASWGGNPDVPYHCAFNSDNSKLFITGRGTGFTGLRIVEFAMSGGTFTHHNLSPLQSAYPYNPGIMDVSSTGDALVSAISDATFTDAYQVLNKSAGTFVAGPVIQAGKVAVGWFNEDTPTNLMTGIPNYDSVPGMTTVRWTLDGTWTPEVIVVGEQPLGGYAQGRFYTYLGASQTALGNLYVWTEEPDPIDCCPPLPQRTDPGCGTTSCGREFSEKTISWSDTLKVDGEYTFPESRLLPVETVHVGIPVGRETRNYRLTIGSALWAPLTIAAVEWTGQYFNNARRTG